MNATTREGAISPTSRKTRPAKREYEQAKGVLFPTVLGGLRHMFFDYLGHL